MMLAFRGTAQIDECPRDQLKVNSRVGVYLKRGGGDFREDFLWEVNPRKIKKRIYTYGDKSFLAVKTLGCLS